MCGRFVFCPISGRQPSAAQTAGWLAGPEGVCCKESTPVLHLVVAPYARDLSLLLVLFAAAMTLHYDGAPRCRLSMSRLASLPFAVLAPRQPDFCFRV